MLKKTAKKYIFESVLAVLFTALYVFCFAVNTVWAANLDYLEYSKWMNNKNITFEEINKTALDEELTGTFGYYTDKDMCVYTFFSLDYRDKDDGAKVTYTYRIGDETYSFSVGSDGMCDALSEEEQRLFSAYSNFSDSKNGVYITAAEYLGKEKECTVDVSFYNSRRSFVIKEGIELSSVEDEEQTTKASASKKESSVSDSKKSEKTTASTKSNSKSASEKATKYSPTGSYTPESSEGDGEEKDDAQEEVSVYEDLSSGKRVMNKNAKIMIVAAIATGALGAAMIAAALISEQKSKKKKENEAFDED